MKDFQGVELSIGDWVAFEQPRYRNLIRGRISSFTPKNINLQYFYQGRIHDFRTLPDSVIKLTKQDYEFPTNS